MTLNINYNLQQIQRQTRNRHSVLNAGIDVIHYQLTINKTFNTHIHIKHLQFTVRADKTYREFNKLNMT